MVLYMVELDKQYPVGSIYLSVNDTDPAELFGGEWEQIEDKFLLACGTKHPNGEIDGSETVSLKKSEMPRHTHTQNAHNHSYGGRVVRIGNVNWAYSSKRQMSHTSGNYYYPYSDSDTGGIGEDDASENATATNQYTGGTNTTQAEQNGSAHENMPPYLAVYCWVRIS